MAVVDIPLNDLLASVYDAPYGSVTEAIVRAIVASSSSHIIAQRLQQVADETQRLEDEGRSLTSDNPTIRALLADMEIVMLGNAALVQSVAPDVMLIGVLAGTQLVRELSLPGVSDDMLAAMRLPFVTVDPREIVASLGYIESPAWAELMEQYAAGTVEQVKTAIITGIAKGQGPLTISRDLRRLVEGLPASNAQQIMRTLQMVSSRDAQQAQQIANAEIFEYQIRIAALDHQTCMACVALCGAILPIGERVNDHHSGRCTSVVKVKGFPVPEVQAGTDWFNALPDSRQQKQMGKAAWDAWKHNRIAIDDFVRPYEDDVFGGMIGSKSLVGILGETAQEFK